MGAVFFLFTHKDILTSMILDSKAAQVCNMPLDIEKAFEWAFSQPPDPRMYGQ